MTLQTSGDISLQDVATEFDDVAPHEMSEFYGAATGIPTSGEISLSDFYGASASFYNGVISGSARFEDGSSAYLSRTFGTPTSQYKWTYSCWIKPSSFTDICFFEAYAGNNDSDYFVFHFDGSSRISVAGFNTAWRKTNALFRDPSAWYHLVLSVDTTQATAANRIKLYINGVEETSFSTNNNPSQNSRIGINNPSANHHIGVDTYAGLYKKMNGYMAEVNFIDGTALAATSFGESKNGCWIPKAYSGSYGTNGFRLDFGTSLTADQSGNGNNWTANNMGSTDLMLDTPENNFATWSSVSKGNYVTLSEGNLKAAFSTTSNVVHATIGVSSGKWYWETMVGDVSNDMVGIARTDDNVVTSSSTYPGDDANSWALWCSGGGVYNNGSNSSYSTAPSTGDIIGVALNMDAGTLVFYKNGTSLGTATSSIGSGTYHPANRPTISGSQVTNFGQDSSFAGNKTAQGNTDGNGYGDFYYTPPTGYLALCTANLEIATAVDPFSGNSPQDHFNTVLYTGNDSSRSITGVGFQPDHVWIKRRSGGTGNHNNTDVLRGVTKRLKPNTTEAESTGFLTSFNSDGFSMSAGGNDTNASGSTYVAWNWKANGSGSSNTDGSITSTVSANTGAGFSIVSFDFQSTGNQTIGHGLSSAPEFIIMKSRDSSDAWWVYHKSFGASYYYRLNTTTGATSNSAVWNTTPTSSVFTIGSLMNTSNYGTSQIAYCFHSVEGFSKFGKYIGNASGDGPFIYTGFRPAFVIIKAVSAGGSWFMFDNKRNGYNETEPYVMANSSNAESTDLGWDLLSNGFKLRHNYADTNTSGYNYMYMAFAENPFKYANAR